MTLARFCPFLEQRRNRSPIKGDKRALLSQSFGKAHGIVLTKKTARLPLNESQNFHTGQTLAQSPCNCRRDVLVQKQLKHPYVFET